MGLNGKGDPPHGELQGDYSRYRKQEVQRPERGTGPEGTQCSGFMLKEGAEQEMRAQVDVFVAWSPSGVPEYRPAESCPVRALAGGAYCSSGVKR